MSMIYTIRCILKPFDFANCFAHHLESILRIDLVDRESGILHEKARSKFVELVSAAAFPIL